MKYQNEMKLEVLAKSENEAFTRAVVGAFAAQLNPTLEELSDVKTAVSEAVTNVIVHAYEEKEGKVYITAWITDNKLYVVVEDKGQGIEDVALARTPFYTSHPESERSGMGFTVMEAFMDELEVFSRVGDGTKVVMSKTFSSVGSPGVTEEICAS